MTEGNVIHPTAYVGPSVRLGQNNRVGAFTFIDGDVTIGDGNWIGPLVTIGTPAQYTTSKFEFSGEPVTGIHIGSRCVLREYCTVHQPSRLQTVIEDDCYLMAYCHVSHDTVLRRGVNMANNTQIGGFSEIQEFATIGLSTVIHQYSTVGAFAMVGMASVITKDVPPFLKAVGNPVRSLGVNAVGLERNGFSTDAVAQIVAAYDAGTLPQDVAAAQPFLERFAARRAGSHRSMMPL